MPVSDLASEAAARLDRQGFVVIQGPYQGDEMHRLARAYDEVMTAAIEPDLRVGTTTTRVSDLVNRGEAFDALYVFAPLVDACRQIIGGPFKLSSLVARTLRPKMPAQELHVDVIRDSADWPLVGFILMVDEFRSENGATRFISESQRWTTAPEGHDTELQANRDDQELACGPSGSLLIFNGSAWHGHTGNLTDAPRRSIHGAFIPRGGRAATDFGGRMTAETRARLSAMAIDVLAIP